MFSMQRISGINCRTHIALCLCPLESIGLDYRLDFGPTTDILEL